MDIGEINVETTLIFVVYEGIGFFLWLPVNPKKHRRIVFEGALKSVVYLVNSTELV